MDEILRVAKGARIKRPFALIRTPEGRDGVVRVVVAVRVGVQVHLAGVGIAVHVHHVLPLLVVVLGDASLHISFFQATGHRHVHALNFMRNPILKGWFQNEMRSARQSSPYASVFKGRLNSDDILGLQEISAIHLR